jgi:hypothetical protein
MATRRASVFLRQRKVAAALQQRDHLRQKGHQLLHTHIPCGFPRQKESPLHLRAVESHTGTLDSLFALLGMLEQVNSMFAGVTCGRKELIQQQVLFGGLRLLIGWNEAQEHLVASLIAQDWCAMRNGTSFPFQHPGTTAKQKAQHLNWRPSTRLL